MVAENVHKQLAMANRLLCDTLSVLRRHVWVRDLFLQITVSFGSQHEQTRWEWGICHSLIEVFVAAGVVHVCRE